MKAPLRLAILFAAADDSAADESKSPETKKPQQQLMPLVFLPGGGPWKGEAPFAGASWTALKDDPAAPFAMTARAGVGDRFPATDTSGVTQFEVLLENGTADHIVLRIISEEGDQKVRVPLDKSAEFKVRNTNWIAAFPTRRVMADVGTRPSTDKAMILIRRPASKAK